MVKLSKLLINVLWLLVGSNQVSLAQQESLMLPKSLENVTFDNTQNRIYYEQRLYRNPMRAMLELQQAGFLKENAEVVPLYQGVPIARYQLNPDFRTTLLTKQERIAIRKAIPFESRRYKFDFRIQPEFIANFGYRERPLESKTNVLLQSQLYLSRGLVLNWGILFPIVNDMDNQPRNIRPAPIFLNQFLALDQADFMSVSAGLFYNDRYGVNVQYRHADLNKPWSFGIETSLSGYYFFPTNDFYYESMNDFMLLADVAYRLSRHNVSLKLSGGQYLYGDKGARIDFIRQFPNVEIGFYASKTMNGSTAGFNFAIPIPPGRIVQSQRVRLRSTEEFRWEYNYSRGYAIGSTYKVGYQLDALLRRYHSQYLKSQL